MALRFPQCASYKFQQARNQPQCLPLLHDPGTAPWQHKREKYTWNTHAPIWHRSLPSSSVYLFSLLLDEGLSQWNPITPVLLRQLRRKYKDTWNKNYTMSPPWSSIGVISKPKPLYAHDIPNLITPFNPVLPFPWQNRTVLVDSWRIAAGQQACITSINRMLL